MKLVYLNPTGQLGGAERVLVDLLATLRVDRREWSLQLIAASDGPLAKSARALEIPTSIVPYPATLSRLGDSGADESGGGRRSLLRLLARMVFASKGTASYVRKLRVTLEELRPHILQTNGFKMHILGLWARPRGVPVIWHVHDYVRDRPMMAKLLRMYASRCAGIVTNSESVRDDVRSVVGDVVEIHCIYNGVDLSRFSGIGGTVDLDALAGLPPAKPGTVRVGLPATLARWKGHSVFLRAISLLREDLLVRAYVIGDAIYQTDGSQYSLDELRRLACELGISHKVGFTGFVEESAAAMRALDIVVHASTRPEPFGLVIAEGMACARPIIASATGGAAEVVSPSIDAMVYSPGDSIALAKCIERLVLDPELRNRLGQAGRLAAERRFDRTRMAREFLPVYLGCLGEAVV